MQKKIFYTKENDGLLEDYQEITFLFGLNRKEFDDKANKSDFFYQIETIEDFYLILQNEKKSFRAWWKLCVSSIFR